jgi:hypothetical protein
MIPAPRLPDLSALDDKLVANYIESVAIGRGFPPGDAQHLVTAFVRSTEGALRRYEAARLQLARSLDRNHNALLEHLRGADDMAVAFMALHRAMRLGEGVMRSPETEVSKEQLPSEADRDKLRVMRNAIDHINDPIIEGRAGKGQTLELHVRDNDSTIDDEDGTHTVSHAEFGEWVRTLHTLAVNLTNEPHVWARST